MAFPSDSLKKRTSAAAERARQVDEMEESCSSLVSVPPHWAFRLIPLTFIFSPARHRAGTGIMGQHQAGVALNLMKSQIILACAYVVAGLLSQSKSGRIGAPHARRPFFGARGGTWTDQID
jgi:hypothetical protein